MIKSITKFLNKNKNIVCAVSFLIVLYMLYNELRGNLKENFYKDDDKFKNCMAGYRASNPMSTLDDAMKFCEDLG